MATTLDSSHGSPESLAGDPRWEAVQRVIASPSFRRAARLSSFLSYICECALLGKSDEISEQQIGIHVFGRPTNFDPALDNIVRGTARQLRQRLAVYYQEDGAHDRVRVTVPRGAYVPVFTEVGEAGLAPEIDADAGIEEAPSNALESPKPRSYTRLALVAVLIALLGTATWWYARPTPVQRFWQTVFPVDRKTFLVPGDSGVVMFQNLTGKTVSVAEYAAGTYRNNATSPMINEPMLASLGSRRYTSFSDLKFATRFVQRKEARADRLEIR